MEGALGGSASVEGGGHSPSWWADGTLRRDGRQHAHVHRMWQKVYRQGRWWWREVSAPARSAGRAHELVQDSPMQPWVEHVSGTDGLTQHVQHAGAHGGLVRARTFDGSGDRACEAQAGARDARGAGFCKEGACAARGVAGSPSAERAPARSAHPVRRAWGCCVTEVFTVDCSDRNDFAWTGGLSGGGAEGEGFQTRYIGGQRGVTHDTGGG